MDFLKECAVIGVIGCIPARGRREGSDARRQVRARGNTPRPLGTPLKRGLRLLERGENPLLRGVARSDGVCDWKRSRRCRSGLRRDLVPRA